MKEVNIARTLVDERKGDYSRGIGKIGWGFKGFCI